MDVAADLAILIRNISSEIHGGQAPGGSAVVDGRVVNYSQKDNLLSVALTHYALRDGEPFILSVPYSMFMAGDTYGDYFYPETDLLCTIVVVESSTGESIQINFAHDALNPPANLNGSTNDSPNNPSIIAPLQPGERLILHKGGYALRFTAIGIQLGSTSYGGQVPAAVEGSIVDPTALLAALQVIVTAAVAACSPPSIGSALAGFTAFQTALTTLQDTSPAYLEPADALMWIDDPLHDPAVGSGGSQGVLLTEAGKT